MAGGDPPAKGAGEHDQLLGQVEVRMAPLAGDDLIGQLAAIGSAGGTAARKGDAFRAKPVLFEVTDREGRVAVLARALHCCSVVETSRVVPSQDPGWVNSPGVGIYSIS